MLSHFRCVVTGQDFAIFKKAIILTGPVLSSRVHCIVLVGIEWNTANLAFLLINKLALLLKKAKAPIGVPFCFPK